MNEVIVGMSLEDEGLSPYLIRIRPFEDTLPNIARAFKAWFDDYRFTWKKSGAPFNTQRASIQLAKYIKSYDLDKVPYFDEQDTECGIVDDTISCSDCCMVKIDGYSCARKRGEDEGLSPGRIIICVYTGDAIMHTRW